MLFVFRIFLFMMVELVRVDYVVPDAVKATYNCSYGGKESVTEPYSEDGVLLSEGLPGGYFVVETFSYFSTEVELENAAEQGDCHETKHCGD